MAESVNYNEKKFKKVYLAKVNGDFPYEKTIIVDKPIYCVSIKNATYSTEYEVDPNASEEQKNKAAEAYEKKAKAAKTEFVKLWYDKKSN